MPNLQDPVVVLTLGAVLVAPSAVGDGCKKEKPVQVDHLFYVTIQNMPAPDMILERFAVVPDVLNKPVKNIQEKCEEIGLVLFGEEAPLNVLLAELLCILYDQYQLLLVEWLQFYERLLPQVKCCMSAQGLSVPDYIKHLHADSAADRLEVWLSLLASGTAVNIVQEDHVWGSCVGVFL